MTTFTADKSHRAAPRPPAAAPILPSLGSPFFLTLILCKVDKKEKDAIVSVTALFFFLNLLHHCADQSTPLSQRTQHRYYKGKLIGPISLTAF